jgi:calcineurin-like phosphoesterase family protein
MYFFTADEHYYHEKILGYCNRPFKNIDEMNEELIKRFNAVVGNDDTTIHVGDFTLSKDFGKIENIIRRLNGDHIFIRGSHDYWRDDLPYVWECEILNNRNGEIEKNYIVACHYEMRVWPRSHYGSFMLFGHSHGKLAGEGKSIDVGVDTQHLPFHVPFSPYSLDEIREIMKKKKDNINQIKK